MEKNRLPVTHPQFIYAKSRNPYAERIQTLNPLAWGDTQAETQKGKWAAQLKDGSNPSNPCEPKLHLELGCNGGHVLLEWAKKNPQALYCGVDWKYKQIFFGAEKAQKRNLSNVRMIRAYHERLPFLFDQGEVDFLYLYFPDPWQKKSQLKNRFITATNLQMLAQLMKPNGVFHIKTDHEGYFDWMIDAINEVTDLWNIENLTRDLHASHPDPKTLNIPEVTLFEKLFIKDGIRIKSVHLRKK